MKWTSLPDWDVMLTPDQSLLESFLRGTMIYLTIFCIMRILPRRQSGEMGMADILLTVLVAEAASQALIGQSFSVPNGIVSIVTLFFWNFILQSLAMRFRWAAHFIHQKPITLLKDGELNKANLDREMLTREQFDSQMREEGISDIKEIKEARIEGDGQTSFIKNE